MGRWRSGAPLVLAPDRDDPELGADPMRNNDFNYREMDPFGYACPLGAHARRLNPRDTTHNMNRRRMIRRGATYGPALPDGAPDDGVDRGVAAFIICASLIRQFEFARVLGRQRVDPKRPHPFTEAGNSEFNALIWMPPAAERAGDIVLIDSTNFTTLFGGTDSLQNFWHNLATMK
jgi:deferrochelatase/peroxidase EfeB